MLTTKNEKSVEIKQRIISSWRRFSHFLREKNIPKSLKQKTMDTVILQSLTTYGAET